MNKHQQELNTVPPSKLILKYAIPAILSGLISAIYNIVDQIFIGQSVGILGNAATNVAFPLTTICLSMTLLFGIGGAANFSLALGRKQPDKAKLYVGASILSIMVISLIISAVTLVFLDVLLPFFGATADNFQYARDYVSISALGFPCFMFSTGMSHLIRADGSPKYAMICIGSGAILNCFLDPLFIFGFNMGIQGAALATITGQTVSAILAIRYLRRFQTFPITREVLKPNFPAILQTASLGIAPATNQISMAIVQIALNNTLTYYGGQSIYGADIPLACVGVISKVSTIYIAIAIGFGQGAQPIVGYHYGAKNYEKVMSTYKWCIAYVSVFSVMAFVAFQCFPLQIISIFGEGTPEYYEFAVRCFRIYLFFVFINGVQPITGNFFSAIGKPHKGMFVALTKQILFLLPLILILPKFMGIDGVFYAGPVADVAAFLLAMIFISREFKLQKKQIAEQS